MISDRLSPGSFRPPARPPPPSTEGGAPLIYGASFAAGQPAEKGAGRKLCDVAGQRDKKGLQVRPSSARDERDK